MNKQQAIESLARLNKESEELKKYIEGCDKEVLWRPKDGDEEYSTIDGGKILSYNFDGGVVDERIISCGEYWQTEEEAQAELDKRLAIQRVIVWIAENLGYDSRKWADWSNDGENKFNLYYKCVEKKTDTEWYKTDKFYSLIGYLKSREDAEKVIEACKSDLELIYK